MTLTKKEAANIRGRKKKRRINILCLGGDEELYLAHSHPDRTPDDPDGGRYIARKSLVWAKANHDGAWHRTMLASIPQAFALVLRIQGKGGEMADAAFNAVIGPRPRQYNEVNTDGR